MRRRQFLRLVTSAAAVGPFGARAQQGALPVIGYLHTRSIESEGPSLTGFHKGLQETGFTERKNVTIEYRWANGKFGELPTLAAELVQRQVNVIAALGGDNSTLAAKSKTTTIPIVFVSGADPVRTGIVTSLNRPTGNVTGVSFFVAELAAKALGLLHELVPKSAIVGVLINPESPESRGIVGSVENSAKILGIGLKIVTAANDDELNAGFTMLVQQRAGAMIVTGDPFFGSRIKQIIGLADRHRIPAIYYRREFPAAGGLMSYGTSIADAYRQAGVYTGRVLKGEKPEDLPVIQSTKFEFVINLKTAKTLGLEFHPQLLATADEVIE